MQSFSLNKRQLPHTEARFTQNHLEKRAIWIEEKHKRQKRQATESNVLKEMISYESAQAFAEE